MALPSTMPAASPTNSANSPRANDVAASWEDARAIARNIVISTHVNPR